MSSTPPATAILVADVGNTRIGLGLWTGDQLLHVHRVDGARPAHWPAVIESIWSEIEPAATRAAAICSVHPERGRALADKILELCGVEPQFVGPDLPLPLKVAYQNTTELGPDRVCAAAAAFARHGAACAVASLGTATTVDFVDDQGCFQGGTILPGLDMSCEALHTFTARLPRIQPLTPQSPIGQTTFDAIAAGVAYAQVGAIREIVERFAGVANAWPQLILTGGAAEPIAELADFVDQVMPDLCLIGTGLAYERAAGTRE